MEEVRDDFPDAFFVVDEGFENLDRPSLISLKGRGLFIICSIYGDNVVICNSSGHETGVAFGNGYFIPCASYSQFTIAIEDHQDDEGVVLYHVAMERLGGLYYLDAEVWGVQYLVYRPSLISLKGRGVIPRAIFRIDFIVDSF